MDAHGLKTIRFPVHGQGRGTDHGRRSKDPRTIIGIVAIFHPFSQFCEIGISLPSL